VVWADVLQLAVYVSGGVAALVVALDLGGGLNAMFHHAYDAGKLRLVNPAISLTAPYTLLGGLIGGALLSAASHGTDQLIVQRLLATRSLREARIALVGSGIIVILQFALFLLVGVAIWSVGMAPDGMAGDQVFPRFIIERLPAGAAGLVIAGILAAAMSTNSSTISALASSVTYDLYATLTGRDDPAHLLAVGRACSLLWGVALIGAGMGFFALASHSDTPAVVFALSIASVTLGALLGTYILAGRWPRARSRDVITAVGVAVGTMLIVVFASRLAAEPMLAWLGPIGRLAWPWYVPLGTLITVGVGAVSSRIGARDRVITLGAS
jgi:Na+/proline symporter